MDASKAFRPLSVVAAAALLLTGVACGGARDRVASRRASTSTLAPASTAVAGASPTTVPVGAASAPSGAAVRTDDLDSSLQQADNQLAQTGTAISDADQNTQQLND